MPGCHTQTHTMTYTHRPTHTRLLSGKQSQRHGVTETKLQKHRLALCDNPLTHIYIQGLEYASMPPSPPPAALRFPLSILSLLSIHLWAFHLIHFFLSLLLHLLHLPLRQGRATSGPRATRSPRSYSVGPTSQF